MLNVSDDQASVMININGCVAVAKNELVQVGSSVYSFPLVTFYLKVVFRGIGIAQ